MSKYVIGVDFGTESGRAVLVDVADGREIASHVHPYANGVIDDKLPGTDIRLDPDFALQDPDDYLEVFKNAIPPAIQARVKKKIGERSIGSRRSQRKLSFLGFK